ncbi:MAG: LamG domain-containing protein, partial [Myxococcota bacterium]
GGIIDTDINLDDFVHGDFTVTMWFQPEFQYGGYGAILGESQSGRLHIGQGDYRKGPYDQDKKVAENPMFAIAIGGQVALFEMPEAKDNAWIHATVVRSGDRITLYINGAARSRYRENAEVPATLDVVPTDGHQPHGTVRLGRRRPGGQFYGFVDDIGIFKKALSPSRVATLASQKRLTGTEADLWRGIGFDKPKQRPLPTRLRAKLEPNKRARRYKVSRNRRRSDRAVWGMPFHLAAAYPTPLQLPFAKGEVWQVGQSMNDPVVSHNGGTAFASMDFNSTAPGCGEVQAPTSGRIINYRQDHVAAPDKNEENFVHLRRTKALGFTLMHLAANGLSASINGGSPHPDERTWNTLSPGIRITKGDAVGTLGPSACHLHVGAWINPNGERIPYPYAEFEVSTDQGKTWRYVLRGIPSKGMWVRRMTDLVEPPLPLTPTVGKPQPSRPRTPPK